jgi:hypothetical protein
MGEYLDLRIVRERKNWKVEYIKIKMDWYLRRNNLKWRDLRNRIRNDKRKINLKLKLNYD